MKERKWMRNEKKKRENILVQEQEQWNKKKLCTYIRYKNSVRSRIAHSKKKKKRGAKSEVMHVHTHAEKAGVTSLGIVIRLAWKYKNCTWTPAEHKFLYKRVHRKSAKKEKKKAAEAAAQTEENRNGKRERKKFVIKSMKGSWVCLLIVTHTHKNRLQT